MFVVIVWLCDPPPPVAPVFSVVGPRVPDIVLGALFVPPPVLAEYVCVWLGISAVVSVCAPVAVCPLKVVNAVVPPLPTVPVTIRIILSLSAAVVSLVQPVGAVV